MTTIDAIYEILAKCDVPNSRSALETAVRAIRKGRSYNEALQDAATVHGITDDHQRALFITIVLGELLSHGAPAA